jgi:hypothetical protein
VYCRPMGPSSLVTLILSSRSSRPHTNRPEKRTTQPQANRYMFDMDDTSDDGSVSDYEASNDSAVSSIDEKLYCASVTPLTSTDIPKQTTLAGGGRLEPSNKRYACTHAGCGKSYRKPSRLREHERSHTGEVCDSVGLCCQNFDVKCRGLLSAPNVGNHT